MPRAAVLQAEFFSVILAEQIGRDEHRRRFMGKASDLTGQDSVGDGDTPVCIRQELDYAAAFAVLLGRFPSAQEVRGMRDRRAPVVRKSLERRE